MVHNMLLILSTELSDNMVVSSSAWMRLLFFLDREQMRSGDKTTIMVSGTPTWVLFSAPIKPHSWASTVVFGLHSS